jgi:hypothetical protein
MGQIVFVTLLLGLTIGDVPMELLVTGDIVKVELVIDHEVIETLQGPPWTTHIDFGGQLAPHRLQARGYDASGRLLASISQKVNAPGHVQQLQLVMEQHDGRSFARVLWMNLDAPKPDAVEARIDSRTVTVGDDLRIPLPPGDGETVHLLSVTVRSDAGDDDAQLVFGGAYEDTSTTALTAVPVRVHGRGVKSADVQCMVGSDGVRVMALDDAPGEVIVIRDPLTADTSTLARVPILGAPSLPAAPIGRPGMGSGGAIPQMANDAVLAKTDRLRFLWPVARPARGGGNALLFYPSRSFETSRREGIGMLLGRVVFPRPAEELRYAEAVAVAVLKAAQSQRPRAVVLVIGRDLNDKSRLTPDQVRHYADRLGVPLYIWSAARRIPEAAKAWGPIIDIRSSQKLRRAVETLRKDLDAQRILWIEGDYLATEVAVTHEKVTALVR